MVDAVGPKEQRQCYAGQQQDRHDPTTSKIVNLSLLRDRYGMRLAHRNCSGEPDMLSGILPIAYGGNTALRGCAVFLQLILDLADADSEHIRGLTRRAALSLQRRQDCIPFNVG